MASLGQLIQIKDLAEGYQPVLLCLFVFQDGSTFHVSSHPLNAGEGGVSAPDYFNEGGGSVDYYSRVLDQSLGELQALSAQGINRVPAVTLKLANGDQDLWGNYELDPGPGFRGAFLMMRLCQWQVGTSNFSSDAPIKFIGTCDAAYLEDEVTLVVQATNSHNTATVKVPDVPVQNRCPWPFPQTAAQRLDGATNRGSQFWNCGYCPDQGFTDPDGNGGPLGNKGDPNLTLPDGTQLTDANGVYVSCDYTRSSGPGGDQTVGCMARLGNYGATNIAPDGDIAHDQAGRATARFGGIQWSPANRLIRSRSYETGAWIDALQIANTSILGGWHNIVYGQQFVTPKVANILEDGNSTRAEAVLCFGQVGVSKQSSANVAKLIVNGVQVPWIGDTRDYVFCWDWVALGTRSGGLNAGQQFLNQGDCYGSLATIVFAVYRDLWDGGGAPNVQALIVAGALVRWNGSQLVRDYSPLINEGDQTVRFSAAWVLMDLLVRANFQYSDLDLDTFASAADFTDTFIHYRNINGIDSTHARYMCEFALTQRATAAEVIDSVLRCFDAYLVLSDQTGKLQLRIRKTLADQQPAPIPGSNDTDPVPSLHAESLPSAIGAGTGYYAFRFDESTIAREGDRPDGNIQISMVPSANSQTPNEILIGFQDTANQYVQDSLTQLEPMSAARCGGTPLGGQPGSANVPETMNVRGVNNFDQAYRIANRYLWEQNYGNEIGDARGTRRFVIGVKSGVQVSHLNIGDIVRLAYEPLGLDQAFRVYSIGPGKDFESCRVGIAWHEDEWYTDVFAQSPYPYYSGAGGDGARRPPYPWRPHAVLPNTTSYRDQTAWNFAVGQQYAKNTDGSVAVAVVISGSPPENTFNGLTPPQAPLEASASGGNVNDPMIGLLGAICAEDGSGSLSRPSRFIRGRIPRSGFFDVDFEGLVWPKKATGWQLFIGPTEQSMCFQAKGDGIPDSVSAPFEFDASYGLPDHFFHHFRILAKPILFGGILITHVTAVSGTSLTLAVPAGFSTDLSQHYLSLYALLNSESLKLPSAAVANTLPEAITALTQAPGAAANSNEQPVNSMPMRDFKISASSAGVVTVTEDPTSAFAPIMQALADKQYPGGADIDEWLNVYYAVTGKPPLTGEQASSVFIAAGVPQTPLSARQQIVALSVFLNAINSVALRAVTGTGLIAMQALADQEMANTNTTGVTLDQWSFWWVEVTGRPQLTGAQVESLLAAAGLTDATRGTYITLDQFNAAVVKAGFDAIGPGGFGDIGISVGDIVCVRTLTDIFGPSAIGSSSFVNAANPNGLGAADSLKGSLARIIGGTGAGQPPVLIAGNDSVSVTTMTPFQITPDATSIFIIESASWPFVSEKTSPILEPLPDDVVSLSVSLANQTGQAFLIMVETVSATGISATEKLSPYREIYVFGSPALTNPQEGFIFGDGPGGTPGNISVGMKTNVRIIGAKDGGTITGWDIRPETVPTGSAAIFDILLIRKDSTGVEQTKSIFTMAGLSASLIVAAAGVAGVQSGIWVGDAVTLQPGDSLQGVVIQKGSTAPGQRVVVNLYWQ